MEEKKENISGREDTMYANSFHRKGMERPKWKIEACKIFMSINVSDLPSDGINGWVRSRMMKQISK